MTHTKTAAAWNPYMALNYLSRFQGVCVKAATICPSHPAPLAGTPAALCSGPSGGLTHTHTNTHTHKHTPLKETHTSLQTQPQQ